MIDRKKVIKALEVCSSISDGEECPKECPYRGQDMYCIGSAGLMLDALDLLKEREKKRITLHKKHVITWSRSDEFSMRKLYETICETLLDEGELFIARTDDHEKVDFVFYVAEGSVKLE